MGIYWKKRKDFTNQSWILFHEKSFSTTVELSLSNEYNLITSRGAEIITNNLKEERFYLQRSFKVTIEQYSTITSKKKMT